MTKFRQIGGSKLYRNWNLWQEEEYVMGKFVGSSTDNYGKESYHIEIVETNQQFDPDHHYVPTKGKNKGKKVFDIELKEGQTIALNHNGSLAYKMGSVNEGEVVKVIYTGKDVLPEDHQYAGAEFHQVEVLVAESDDESDDQSLDSFTQL